MFAYDSRVTEPCAYNVHPDQYKLAETGAEWVAKTIGDKGNILLVTGVPGTDRRYRPQQSLQETSWPNIRT